MRMIRLSASNEARRFTPAGFLCANRYRYPARFDPATPPPGFPTLVADAGLCRSAIANLSMLSANFSLPGGQGGNLSPA